LADKVSGLRDVMPVNRRHVVIGATGLGLTVALSSFALQGSMQNYESIAAKTREALAGNPELKEILRYATLAANSHNTQAWRFALTDASAGILPDYERRTPVVDPDDHHLFASLGCAVENLSLAARASGRSGDVAFDETHGGVVALSLATGAAVESKLFQAIPQRQCTRSLYSGAAVPAEQLKLLEEAARIDGVDLILITDRDRLETVLDYLIAANSAQISNAAYVAELKRWIRFNPAAALAARDGLFSACSDNPTMPTWIGNLMFPLAFTTASENSKLAAHVRSSAGMAVFVGKEINKAHWFKAGRAY
jgi:hypothetical protein